MTRDSVSPPVSVLVVEGSPAIRRLFEVVLREVADPLFLVADQDAAHDVLATEPIDLVILELQTATEICWRLLDDLAATAIPVIVVTSRVDEKVQLEATRRGAVAFVSKPFRPAALQRLIRDLMPRTR